MLVAQDKPFSILHINVIKNPVLVCLAGFPKVSLFVVWYLFKCMKRTIYRSGRCVYYSNGTISKQISGRCDEFFNLRRTRKSTLARRTHKLTSAIHNTYYYYYTTYVYITATYNTSIHNIIYYTEIGIIL